MKIKQNAKIETGEFWYDLFDGGYIKPEKLLENKEDIEKVRNAMEVIRDFRSSCENIIEYM